VDPVPDPLLLRKNLVAPGIELGPLDLYSGTLTTRPQRGIEFLNIIQENCSLQSVNIASAS
jgi:hypothetical protein